MSSDLKVTPEWMASAVCADPDLGSSWVRARVFFPPSSNSAAPASSDPGVWVRAKAVYASCPVRVECLDHAIEHGETDSVWGGLDPAERKIESRRRRRRLSTKKGQRVSHPDTERLLEARGVKVFEFVEALPLVEVHEPTSSEQQYRVEVYDAATVARYKADLDAGDRFPPLIVRRRNKTGGFVLLSGMHRWHAARELGWDGFPAYIVRCTPAVGRLISFDANRTHGKGFAGGRGHRKPERERLQNALFALLDVDVDQVAAELADAPELAEFTRSRIRDAAGHLLKIGQAVDKTMGAGR